MSGEEHQEKGRSGARRAKVWLESTTRVSAQWENPVGPAARKLGFVWADGTTFSFDLGGIMLGGDWNGENFFAEVKNQATGVGDDYREFVAKALRAVRSEPARCDHFMYISWAPFLVTSWSTLGTWAFVRKCALDEEFARRIFGDDVPDEKDLEFVDQCKAVADKLWLIILTDKQVDFLRPDPKHVEMIKQAIVREAEE